MLHEREIIRSAQWTRPDSRIEHIAGEPFERELEVDIFSLIQAFQSVMARSQDRPTVALPAEIVPIETRIDQLLEILSLTDARAFEELFTHSVSRRELITTFLAVLEMIRLKLIRVVQSNTFGPITVYKRSSSKTYGQDQEGKANDRRSK